LECPNNASTPKNKCDELKTGNNNYKNIPLNVARIAQANAQLRGLRIENAEDDSPMAFIEFTELCIPLS
jgi:hypothetical protein